MIEEWPPVFSQSIETGNAVACSGMRAIDSIVIGAEFRSGCTQVVPCGAPKVAGGQGEGVPGPPDHQP